MNNFYVLEGLLAPKTNKSSQKVLQDINSIIFIRMLTYSINIAVEF